MAKVSQGGSFGGAVGYVLNRGEAYILALRGIKDGTIAEMARSFEMQAQLNPITKPVAHISLNFSAEDRAHLTDEKMAQIAVEYMEKMGYGNTQFLMVRHTDREHPHLHLILNRVDFDGKRISDRNERIRNIKVTQELTRRHGLFVAVDKSNVKRHRLRGREKVRYEIHDSVHRHLPRCKSWVELQGALLRDGVGVEFKYNGSTDQIQGVKFSKDGQSFSGSKVDRSCSYSKIDFVLRQNFREEQAHEREQLFTPTTEQNQQQSHSSDDGLASAIGSLFDLPDTPVDDIDEERFRHAMQKKKRRGIRR